MLKPTGPKDAGGDYANNYTKHYSPDDPISGQKLMGVDQAAMEAKQRIHERHESLHGDYPIAWDPNSEHDYKAIRTMDKRKDRGGATFRPKDTMGCD